MGKEVLIPAPPQHRNVHPPVEMLCRNGFNPYWVKEEMKDGAKANALPEFLPKLKKYWTACSNPVSFFPTLENVDVEITSFTHAVNDWYAAVKKRNPEKYEEEDQHKDQQQDQQKIFHE